MKNVGDKSIKYSIKIKYKIRYSEMGELIIGLCEQYTSLGGGRPRPLSRVLMKTWKKTSSQDIRARAKEACRERIVNKQ